MFEFRGKIELLSPHGISFVRNLQLSYPIIALMIGALLRDIIILIVKVIMLRVVSVCLSKRLSVVAGNGSGMSHLTSVSENETPGSRDLD